ncbi:MAG TPA: carboxyl transferase domain-containing protein [Frankiaceae bacterium]|nr:carboxyl transferase domain-containing protein [Frankiaceae bacterium]
MIAPEPARTLLVANRGEIAVRILRTAAQLGFGTRAVYSSDDAAALHVRLADEAAELPGAGPAAYLDAKALVDAAVTSGAELLHPGYGFLSENAELARACTDAGVTFVGPAPEVLDLVGDKTAARRLAEQTGLPILAGSDGPVDAEQAIAFLDGLGAGAEVLLKAASGGGGRGMRVVRTREDLPAAFDRAASEALAAFGNGSLYVERLLPDARHLEVQVIGDGSGTAVALGDRDCSVQRRHQKVLEIAPAPQLRPDLRSRLATDATTLTSALRFRGIGTVEFLLGPGDEHVFLEMNPRLQVEHPVTEMVFGVDLVAVQLQLALGATLPELELPDPTRPRGAAVQLRICAETAGSDGALLPAAGTISSLHLPGGAGVRVDTAAYAGWHVSARFDSLLAKLIVSAEGSDERTALASATRLLRRALREVRIDGVATNVGVLAAVLDSPDFVPGGVSTQFFDRHRDALLQPAPESLVPAPVPASASASAADHRSTPAATADLGPAGSTAVAAPLQGTVVDLAVQVGDEVAAGTPLVVLEAMKMEQVVQAPHSGTVVAVAVNVDQTVAEGDPLLFVLEGDVAATTAADGTELDLDTVRPDLAALYERRALLTDEARPDAVAKRHAAGHRTARENLDDLIEPGSLVEFGALTFAAQRGRRSVEDLMARTPADGLIGGLAQVNAGLLAAPADGRDASRCAVLSYDYMVLAGTQGTMGHRKKDRLFDVIERLRLPTIFFAEGGGGRPGDTDYPIVSALDVPTFAAWGRLSGLVPRIGIVGGRCFAGNAAIFGCSDITIATADSSIGMGGPAMIEGGGLGIVGPDEVGPTDVQVSNGVIDIVVDDDAAAVRTARQALGYFQGRSVSWDHADQRRLRFMVPENRLRVYDVRQVLATVADAESVLELRAGFAPGMVTALARLEGRPIGVVANNPAHLAGAITSENADKAARFLQLCDAFDLPVLFLCDTPGIMVGPEAESTGLVRHASRLFVTAASMSVPFGTVVLRKGYGLGAQAMAGGGFLETLFTVSWPTGEFGAMGLEGAVKLGMRKELEAIADPVERQRVFDQVVAMAYERGKAMSMASALEIDDVIDPADTRRVVAAAFASAPPPPVREGKKRPMVDTW